MALEARSLFVRQLNDLLVSAGNPTLAELERLEPGKLADSTISTMLRGGFKRPPRWDRVEAFVRACVRAGEAASRPMPPVDILLSQWRYHYGVLEATLEASRANIRPSLAKDDVHGTEQLASRRLFGALPSRAGAFQHRNVASKLNQSTVSVLTGLGGVGKTQIAANHARTMWETGQLDLLAWIPARSRDSIIAAYVEIAINRLDEHTNDPGRLAERFLNWLTETGSRWMLVFDDVQDPADLSGLWPPNRPKGKTVVTTRRRDAALHGDRREFVEVNTFTEREAIDYLTSKLPGRSNSNCEIETLAELANDFGHLPLALAQAATYLINSPLLSTANYRAQLANQRTSLRECLPDERELPDEHTQNVAAAWSLSIAAADQLKPPGVARPTLHLASLLDPAGIPVDFFTNESTIDYVANVIDREVTETDTTRGLQNLQRFNLINLATEQPNLTVQVHSLVQRTTREDLLDSDEAPTSAIAAANALMTMWQISPPCPERAAVLRANARALQTTTGEHLWDPQGHPVLFQAGRSLGESGMIAAAISYHEALKSQAQEQLGYNHPDVLRIRYELARWRDELGFIFDARTELEELLVDQSQALGKDSEDTLKTRSHLAYLKGEHGDPRGAFLELGEILSERLRTLGPDHPNTFNTRNHLAFWRGVSGNIAESMKELELLLADRLRIFGPDDPETLNTRSHLAYWRGEAGDPAGAIEELEKLLVDRTRILGPDDPDTLNTRSQLACWRGEAGDPAGAIEELEKLLVDRTRILGPDDPDTLNTRSQLACWRGEAGDPTGAIEELEELLSYRACRIGPNHPDTFATRSDLAYWKEQSGATKEAIKDLHSLLLDQTRVLGEDDPATQATKYYLANLDGDV